MIRIVSFDFWFTLVWEDLEGLKYYQDRRIEVLYNALRNYTDVSLDEVRVFYKSTGGIRMLVSNKELIKFIFRMAGLTPTDDILDDIVKEYEEVVDNWKPHVNEEAYGVLEGLKKLGYKIAIISNTSFSERSLWFIIRNVGFDKYIDGVIASSEVGYIKPMREIFRELFNKFNVSPKEVIHIGDSYFSDVIGAFNAGAYGVLYNGLWRYYIDEEDYKNAISVNYNNRCIVLSNLNDIFNVLDRIESKGKL